MGRARHKFTPLRTSEGSETQEADFVDIYAGQVRWTVEPGRIGFMSSQRRENRWQRRTCAGRAEVRSGLLLVTVQCPARAGASGGTAPPEIPARWVTNSLLTDFRLEQRARQDARHNAPPSRAGGLAVPGLEALRRLSFQHIPTPPGLASFHPASPQAPAA